MFSLAPVPPETFEAIQHVDIDRLSTLPENSLRAILPCLVRMSLCHPLDSSDKWTKDRKKILKCLSGIEVVNSLVGLLSIDFHALEQDAKKEQQLRAKMGGTHTESILIAQLEQSLALEFERSDAARKLRLLLSELLFIMSQIKENKKGKFYTKSSELFESEVYLEEVSDVLCIAQAELPHLLPVSEVAEALLHVKNGAWLLTRLVANVAHTFHQVCLSLVTSDVQADEGERVGTERRSEALSMLCKMCPSQALTIRRLCVEHHKLPDLAVTLTLSCDGRTLTSGSSNKSTGSSSEQLGEVVAFISGLFFSADTETKTWFSQFVRLSQKKAEDQGVIGQLRQELLRQLRDIPPTDSSLTIAPPQVIQGCVFMRLYCTLKATANLKFNEDEIAALLNLVTCRPPPTASGVRFISLALCVLIGCPYIISTLEHERRAVDWIRWLVKEGAQFENVAGEKGSFAEMMLLVAIHFHGGQNQPIADLVNATLGIKGVVKTGTLAKLKMIFTQEIFTEQVVASHAVRVPVTRGLCSDIQGYLPIHCIYQLLKNRTFSKHKVPIKDWIFRQLCVCTTPLHPLVPQLIEVYIQSILLPTAKTDRTNEPITEQEIRSLFNRKEGDSSKTETQDLFTTQILIAFYVLFYQDMMNANMKQIASAGRKVHTYGTHILSEIPVKSLLQEAQKQQRLYAKVFSQLLRLLVTHYPHLCLVEDWLDEENTDTATFSSTFMTLPDLPCTTANLQQAFDVVQHSSIQLLIHFKQLNTFPDDQLMSFKDVFIKNLAKLMEPGIPKKLLDVAQKVWIKYHTLTPTKVRLLTVNALSDVSNTPLTVHYTENDLTLDPLTILRCDPRVFRCPQLMEITLRVLSAFLQASRCFLNARVQASSDKPSVSVVEQEELKTALLAAQESAAAQILLEACLPTATDTGGALSELREIQCLICSHLHHMFIADPSLAKLIHFQGYPTELLAVTVPGIPSMHICLDFIPELISQPDIEKQMFAVNLVSHLSVQYSLPKSLAVARLAVNVMSTLVGVLSNDSRLQFYLSTLPALSRICRAFPPLCDDVVSVLLHVGQVCRSQLMSVSSGQYTAEDVFRDLPTDGRLLPRKPHQNHDVLDDISQYSRLLTAVYTTFNDVVGSTALLRHQLK